MDEDTNAALTAALQPDMDDMDSMEIMKWLSEVQAERFVQLEETFATPGWKILSEWARVKSLEAFSMAANANTWEECKEAQGAKKAMEDVSDWDKLFLQEFKLAALSAKEGSDIESEDFQE